MSTAGFVASAGSSRAVADIGGGIVPCSTGFYVGSRWRARFGSEGRSRADLEAVPSAPIIEPHAAPTGAAAAIEYHLACFPRGIGHVA